MANSVSTDSDIENFVLALQAGDDARALSLLRYGYITIHSRIFPGGLVDVDLPWSMVKAAVYFGRGEVVEALARKGTPMDEFEDPGDGCDLTPAGYAIVRDNAAMLALCRRLGSSMSSVGREVVLASGHAAAPALVPWSPPRSMPAGATYATNAAVETAVFGMSPACLAYLLDEVYPARPVALSRSILDGMCHLKGTSIRVTETLKVLETRGLDFRSLKGIPADDMDTGVSFGRDSLSLADILLSNARRIGDADLVSYIVKGLGVVSTVGHLEVAKDVVGLMGPIPGYPVGTEEVQDAVLAKHNCAACEAVSATKTCGRCKVARYCSAACQKRHWNSGGHKTECSLSLSGAGSAGS